MTDEEMIEFAKANLVFNGREYFSIEEAQQKFDVGPIIRRFGAWAVTEYGVECLVLSKGKYTKQTACSHWIQGFIVEKTWQIPNDFQDEFKNDALNALMYCTELMEDERIKPGQRFRILRRDKYRCRLCGRSAADGVTLEVDHQHPKDKGGSNEDSNLWTLCFDCNRGKSNSSL